jgi:hypothetical protein
MLSWLRRRGIAWLHRRFSNAFIPANAASCPEETVVYRFSPLQEILQAVKELDRSECCGMDFTD